MIASLHNDFVFLHKCSTIDSVKNTFCFLSYNESICHTDTKYRYTPGILCFCIERAFYKSRPLLAGIDNLGVWVSEWLSSDKLYLCINGRRFIDLYLVRNKERRVIPVCSETPDFLKRFRETGSE